MNENDIGKRLEKIEKTLSGFRQEIPPLYLPDSTQRNDREIDLLELFGVLWRGKWLIVSITLMFFVVSIFYAKSLPNIYKSEVLLAPAEENNGGGLAQLAGQFGGLANIAGFNLGSGANDKTALAIEVLKSREFIKSFISNRDVLVEVVAVKGWDRGENRLIFDGSIYSEKDKKWVRKVAPPKVEKPSDQEAYKAFIDILSVSQDSKTNFVKISIEHYSPFVAKKLVDWLVEDINKKIKLRDVTEAEKSIHFLKKQMDKITIAEVQAVFHELIEEQTKTIMFAEVRAEYAFKTIDQAVVAEQKFKPKKALIVILVTMLGGMLSVVLVFVISAFKKGEKFENRNSTK